MSPILVRPVREQLEHDRVIRLLQAKYKRKFEVGVNPGAEHAIPVGSGPSAMFPDLVLQSPERGRRLLGVVEVETSESVNHLEALSQWAAFGRLRAPFFLYVPAGSIDTARRLCMDHHIGVAELWTFHPVGDQMRFTLIARTPTAQPRAEARPAARQPLRAAASAASRKPGVKPRARPARRAKAAPSRAQAKSPLARSARAQKRK